MKLKKSPADMLIYLCWLAYSISYVGKVNYSANITQIVDFFRVSKAEAGLALTFFFFAYGIGQVVNGVMSKKYNIKWTIFFSLVCSAVLNFAVAVTPDFSIVKWLWLVNGFVLSLLWPLLIRLISESVSVKALDKANVVLGTTVASGTLIIYALSSVYAMFGPFHLAFYTAAAADLAVALVWLFTYKKAVDFAKQERNSEIAEAKANHKEDAGEETMHPALLKVVIGFLCAFAVGVNLVKDGLNTWVPSILKEEYAMTDSLAIFLTLFLPLMGIFGTPLALKLRKKLPDYIVSCTVCFGVVGVAVAVIMWCLQAQQAAVMLVCLLIASFMAGTLNAIVASVFPLYMRKMVNSGIIAGVINGFCYLGSTISSYGLGYIADKKGWTAVFLTLLLFCVFVYVCCVVYSIIKKALLRKNEKSIVE